MNRPPQAGFTLIELTVVVSLLAVLLLLGMPAMTGWVATQRVRTSAEGVLNGLQLARAEAVRRNTLVDLQIAADGMAWNVVADGAIVQRRDAEPAGGVSTTLASATTVTFNGIGQMIAPTTFAVRYTSAASGVRAMCVAVTTSTPRMCDPQRTDSTDPAACFVGGVAIAGCS